MIRAPVCEDDGKLANASDGIKPRVEQSGTRGYRYTKTELANASGGPFYRPSLAFASSIFFRGSTPGSALLHPGLHAVARIRELRINRLRARGQVHLGGKIVFNFQSISAY